MIGASTFTSADILPNQNGSAVYDIDGQEATEADVAAIHAAGAIAVCYVDVGTLEQGRPDYGLFPSSVIGPGVAGWPGENWLLLTPADQAILLPLMKARFENWCLAKGFDAIEPDNLDGWTNISNIGETDNLTYDLAIASLAHALPLSIGLKNLMTDLGLEPVRHLPRQLRMGAQRAMLPVRGMQRLHRLGQLPPCGQGRLRRRVQHLPGPARRPMGGT